MKDFVEKNLDPVLQKSSEAVVCVEGIDNYNRLLKKHLEALKEAHGLLFGYKKEEGDENPEQLSEVIVIEEEKIRTNPEDWFKLVYSKYDNLQEMMEPDKKAKLNNKKVKSNEKVVRFHINKSVYDLALFNFKNKKDDKSRSYLEKAGRSFNSSRKGPGFLPVVRALTFGADVLREATNS